MASNTIDFKAFPTTRYQGSKRKILPWIHENIKDLNFKTAIDVFGGTASVSYLLKKMGKQVTFNDKLRCNYLMGKALIQNNRFKLNKKDLNNLINNSAFKTDFIEKTFKDIYYPDDENRWLDLVASNIVNMNHYQPTVLEYKKSLAYYAIFQACIIKRPFNLFHRKNLNLRTNEVERNFGNKTTWDTTFDEYLVRFSDEINSLIIDTGEECNSLNSCAFDLDPYGYQFAYFDPPYFRRDAANESSNYSKCYHFLEGLSNYNAWPEMINYETINLRTKVQNSNYEWMKDYPIEAFEELICKFRRSKLVFSYKRGGKPSIGTIVKLMKKFKRNVRTTSLHYKYALNHQNGDAKKNREVFNNRNIAMKEIEQIWPKHITVDRRIVSVLSQSTYDNFPKALKELITNSYDADAKKVYITINLEKEIIIIEDNGSGMNEADFEFYLRIAGKTRKKEEDTTKLGRKIIGQFGVGFLSIFPFFKNYTIETKKSGASPTLYADIPLYKYFSNPEKIVDIESIQINGGVRSSKANPNSYTKIILQGFNGLTSAFFNTKRKLDKNLIETFSGIDKLKWILSDDLPIRFRDERFNEIFSIDKIPFDVYVNESQILRDVYGNEILETHKADFHKIGRIKFRYCILTPKKGVQPYAGRYLKMRNLNVGVGDAREHFGLAHGATRSRLHWLTGEVHIIEGMNDLIKVSRDGFNYSPDFEDVKEFLNEKLNYFSTRLEAHSNIKREITQTGKEFRINNVSLLREGGLIKKVKQLEEQGFDLKAETKNFDFQKHIVIKNKRYVVSAEAWDANSSDFPACRIDGRHVILNMSYPLFKGRKYVDLFVKTHLMLLMNYEEQMISFKLFKHFSNEILDYFSDYIK